MIIHTFLYDSDFLNSSSILDPVLKTGGVCVLSPQSLSYFVTPQEFPDERTARAGNLNVALSGKANLVVDQSEFQQFLTDVQDTWSVTERENLFAIIDQLCFAYSANNTPAAIELALAAWPQYLTNTYVYSNTTSAATVYTVTPNVTIAAPDYVDFTFVIANGTQYQLRIWLSNTKFAVGYPLSTISVVVPPLPLSQLYTLAIVGSIDNVFTTALSSSTTSQQALQSYIASGEYSGYYPQDVQFVDANGNTTMVQFNLLYQGATPGVIAVRTAIRNFLLASGVGTQAGWQSRAPSLFVTQLWYLLPLWDVETTLVDSVIYPNIVPVATVGADATVVLYDIDSGFVAANLDVVTAYYNNMTLAAVPDTENATSRLSLAAEHPTYQDIATTNPVFANMTTTTQQFATLLGGALSLAAGNPSTNSAFVTYTPPGDNRTYITFSVADVEYYVITQTTYLALVDQS